MYNNEINVTKPIDLGRAEDQIFANLIEANAIVNANEARQRFNLSGKGQCVAVLDTGIWSTHNDFKGRIKAQLNFTTDNNGAKDDALDGNGHGTNVTGIVAARSETYVGMAPEADIVSMKVLRNDGGGSFDYVESALDWVINNHTTYNITSVCMSLGDSGNYDSDAPFLRSKITQQIDKLYMKNIAVVIAAGNDFFPHGSKQGMGFPSIIRNCISVGAVFDAFGGKRSYRSGAIADSTDVDRITPFSQRLHSSVSLRHCETDIFAPGATITSSGIGGDTNVSLQDGTSQATPVVAGIILLMQEYGLRLNKQLPSVDDILRWIKGSAVNIFDGDDEADNVKNPFSTIRIFSSALYV